MNLSRSAKSEIVAAFLLGGLIALLLATPARSAETFRLDRLAIVRFTPTPDDRLLLQHGALNIFDDVQWRVPGAVFYFSHTELRLPASGAFAAGAYVVRSPVRLRLLKYEPSSPITGSRSSTP